MAADKYDFIITYSANNYKYMLRQKGDTKDFLVTDAPLTPQTLITESASPTNIQPERRIQVSQVDWRKGFQDLMLEDEHRYNESENCDARFKGEVTLPPKKLAAITSWDAPPSVPSITNLGFETGDLTGWTLLSGDLLDGVRNDNPYHGTYAAYASIGGGATQAGVYYQDLSWDNKLRGKTFTFSMYGDLTGDNEENAFLQVSIDDGVSITESSEVHCTSYTKVSVTKTLAATATKLRVRFEYKTNSDAVTATIDIDYAEISSTMADISSGGVIDIVEFGDDIIVAASKNLYSFDGSATTYLGTFPRTITDLCVFENRLYIAQGWGYDYYYTSDLITFTAFTDAAVHPKYFANIGGGVMICSDSNNSVKSSANPINGGTAWSTAYTVGSDDWDITGLVDHEDTWFVRKEDNVYYLSGSDVYPLIPELASEASTTYTYGLYYWKGCLYIGSGVNSLYEYDVSSGVVTTLSPVKYAPGDANYDEELLALCGDESYLYAAFDNGSDIKILSGRWEIVEGDTDWYWHPLYDITSNDITSMLISSLSGSKRLYTGTATYTDGVIPYFIPVGYSQPYTENGYECQSSGVFYTPWYVSNFPTESKYWKSVDFTSICCTDKTSIIPYYQVKGGGWVALTALTTSAYAGGYPAETTDSRTIEQTSERIRFKFAMAAADDDYTPILYGTGGGIVAYAVLQSDKKRQIIVTIHIAHKIRLRNNKVEKRTVSTDLTNLRTIYKAGGEITITAPDETTYNCVFARDGYEEQLAYDKTMRQEVWWCTLKLLEI